MVIIVSLSFVKSLSSYRTETKVLKNEEEETKTICLPRYTGRHN